MKKILFIFIILMSFVFISCNENKELVDTDDSGLTTEERETYLNLLNNYSNTLNNLTLDDIKNIPNEINYNGQVISFNFESKDLNKVNNQGEVLTISEDTTCIITLKFSISDVIVTKDVTIDLERNNYEKIVIGCDEKLYVHEGCEITINGSYDIENYDYHILDETIATLDEWCYLTLHKVGKTYLYINKKDKPDEVTKFEIVVNYAPLHIKSNMTKYTLNRSFTLSSQYDLNDVNFEYDTTAFEKEDGTFTPVKIGSYDIKVTHKLDSECFDFITIQVSDPIPELDVETNMTIGSSYRISVLNYGLPSDYNILYDEEYFTKNGINLTPIKLGTTTIKVIVSFNSDLYKEISVDILPVMPEGVLSQEYCLVNNCVDILFLNKDKLSYKDLTDYNISTTTTDICIIENNHIKALKVGDGIITVTNKTDPRISCTLTLHVIENNTSFLSGSGLTSGPIVITSPNDSYQYKVGEMIYLGVDGDTNVSNYTIFSSNITVCTVFDDLRFIAVGEGYTSIIVRSKKNNEILGKMYLNISGFSEVNYVERLLTIAEKEIGYVEGPNNDTKYGKWYNLNYEPWCAMFVSWCCNQAGISTDIVPRYASVRLGYEWFEKKNQIGLAGSYTPKAGDIIFFLNNGASHTGIVIACENGIVYTIEGNTSDRVAKRQYSLSKDTIKGYGIPNYPNYQNTSGSTEGATSGDGESTL